MTLVQMAIGDIKPYENNPRKNGGAVDAVAESIRQCGYVAPIIVDEDNVVLAGHTRLKALIKLGYTTANCLVASGLTAAQKRKYRLLDNKTGELAEWDFDLLMDELGGLDFDGFDFGFGLNADDDGQEKERQEAKFTESISVVIDCKDDEEAEEIYNRLTEGGYTCRISTL